MQKRNASDQMEKRLAALKAAKPVDAPASPAAVKKQRPTRSGDRAATYRIIQILIDDGSAINAVLKDVSPGGAKIALEGAQALPPRVRLKIDMTGETRKASVVWQNDAEAGLAFDAD